MPKPVCVSCRVFFRPEKNGFRWTEGMPFGDNKLKPIGDAKWTPYKTWVSDKWKCPGCGAEIIVGHSSNPTSVHHMNGFADFHELSQLQVDDC